MLYSSSSTFQSTKNNLNHTSNSNYNLRINKLKKYNMSNISSPNRDDSVNINNIINNDNNDNNNNNNNLDLDLDLDLNSNLILNSNNNSKSKFKRSKSTKSNSKKPKKETPPEKRRVRTGCLTCRSKHKKCDETKPICKFCQSKNLQCIWPHEGMSRPAQLNDTLKQLLSLKNLENSNNSNNNNNNNNNNSNLNINDNSISPDLSINNSTSTNFNDLLSNSIDITNNNSNNKIEQPKYLKLPSNFPSILSIIPALQNGNFSSNLNSFIFFNDKSVTSTNSLFTQSLTNLLSNYFLTDPTYILHLSNPNHILSLSRESKSLTYSILAISSRLLEQFDTSYSGENTLDFYLLSVRELSKSLRNQINGIINKNSLNLSKECIWWTVLLLSWFEIFSVNPINCWDRLEGIMNFFDTLSIFEDTKSFHTFSSLIMIPWCCKIKYLQDKSNEILTPTSASILIDSTIELSLQKICSSKHDISNLTFQTFFIKNGDIKQWVDLWNSLLDWKLRSNGNEEFKQPDGAIILAVDKDLFNNILYHVACYHLLNNKPDNISLIFQSPNDFTTIVAFAMCQDRQHDCDELIQWHRNRLIKILESNMITKNKKSIYSSCACWFAGYVLNDDKFDKSEIKNLLIKISSWCNLEIFKWLIETYN